MKFTIIRRTKDGSHTTVQAIDANELIIKQKNDYADGIIRRYREVALALDVPERWLGYKKMAHVCPVNEYYRNKAGEQVWRCYNGVSVVEIEGLNGSVEVNKAKKAAALMPQTLFAFTGADGHSVVVLTASTLPDGSLPRTEEQASLFCTQAEPCKTPHSGRLVLSGKKDRHKHSCQGGYLITSALKSLGNFRSRGLKFSFPLSSVISGKNRNFATE